MKFMEIQILKNIMKSRLIDQWEVKSESIINIYTRQYIGHILLRLSFSIDDDLYFFFFPI